MEKPAGFGKVGALVGLHLNFGLLGRLQTQYIAFNI
jgi:hypothetical protein